MKSRRINRLFVFKTLTSLFGLVFLAGIFLFGQSVVKAEASSCNSIVNPKSLGVTDTFPYDYEYTDIFKVPGWSSCNNIYIKNVVTGYNCSSLDKQYGYFRVRFYKRLSYFPWLKIYTNSWQKVTNGSVVPVAYNVIDATRYRIEFQFDPGAEYCNQKFTILD